jgi:Raf kinase inhibitor-like YbhB/YbcL family protein
VSRTVAATVLLAAFCARAQAPDPVTDFSIEGHVYEPQPVSPTDEALGRARLPNGFKIARFAEGLDHPRMLAVAKSGAVYVTQRDAGNLVLVQDVDGDGVADRQRVVLELPKLHGVTLNGRRIYLADVKHVYRADLRADGSVAPPIRFVRDLPDGGQHPNRTLAFGPDGALYVSVGSTCNACDESSPESATLLRVRADGRREIFASGLRNTIGFGWHPGSKRLYGMDNGIDWLGDTAQSEELNENERGVRDGWPYVYDDGEPHPQDEPRRASHAEWAAASRAPVGGYTPHAAPMQLVFYEGDNFPPEYRNDAFVAMHGSWNRKPPSGYEVVRVAFDPDGSFDRFERFLSGLIVPRPDLTPADGFLARPVGLAVASDGALLVGDDANGAIYRVAYGGSDAEPTPQVLASELLEARSADPIEVRSPAFAPEGEIPAKYSDYERGPSPPLTWTGVPANTRSLVLLMEDPDATSPVPFVHWLLANVSPEAHGLAEDVAKVERPPSVRGGLQGSNSLTRTGYLGPRPPAGDAAHAYHFQLFALDVALEQPSGFNRHALVRAMQGHVLAKGDLVGRFAKRD